MNQEPIKVQCPSCETTTKCFEDTVSDTLKSYMCMKCGYMSCSNFKVDTDYHNQLVATFPKLIVDLAIVDTERNIVWYPCVINSSDKGMIFPDGTSVDDWMWSFAPLVPVTEDEKHKYQNPDKPGEAFVNRLAMDQIQQFSRFDFEGAAKAFGLIVESNEQAVN